VGWRTIGIGPHGCTPDVELNPPQSAGNEITFAGIVARQQFTLDELLLGLSGHQDPTKHVGTDQRRTLRSQKAGAIPSRLPNHGCSVVRLRPGCGKEDVNSSNVGKLS